MRTVLAGMALVSLLVPGCAAAPPAFNETDTAWLQLMISMDEQMVTLLDLVPGQSETPAVREFAARTAGPRGTEVVHLRETRDRAGLPATDMHAGHRMPGMATADEVVAMRQATGPDFDRQFLAAARGHVEQTITLAQGEQQSGADTATKQLAAEIERTRREDLAQLHQIAG